MSHFIQQTSMFKHCTEGQICLHYNFSFEGSLHFTWFKREKGGGLYSGKRGFKNNSDILKGLSQSREQLYYNPNNLHGVPFCFSISLTFNIVSAFKQGLIEVFFKNKFKSIIKKISFITQFAQDVIFKTMEKLVFTRHIVLFVLFQSLYCTVYSVQCTMYTVYSVHCTLYTIFSSSPIHLR